MINTMHRLAIVIPAYKGSFLDEALQSIATQSCKDFKVYVGDDASPHDLRSICEQWQGSVDLHYHRFEKNLGRRDLVAQWERCVALSHEPWIWLFGDDDRMEPECVSAFYRELASSDCSHDIYHFNVRIIDALGTLINEAPEFPSVLSASEFALKRFRFELSSFAPDYVFARDAFLRVGGFQSFPCAWCSDDATWIKLAGESGIKTVFGPKVHWRFSSQNICSDHSRDRYEKLAAAILYIEWVQQYFQQYTTTNSETFTREFLQYSRRWLFTLLDILGICFWSKLMWESALLLHRVYSENPAVALLRVVGYDLKKLRERVF